MTGISLIAMVGKRQRLTALALSTVVTAVGSQTLHVDVSRAKAPEVDLNPGQALALRKASTVQVRRAQGEALGSGVIVAMAQGGYWVATNRHVIQGLTSACLITADQQSHPALIASPEGASGLDLAFLWFAGGSRPQAVASLPGSASAGSFSAESLPLVVASGYPLSGPVSGESPAYQEREGLALPLLRKPLEGGYTLAYTSLVEKGMSGGGLFWGRQLVGLNGVHADPLWEGIWKQEDGLPLPAAIQAKLELVSLAIPTSRLLPLLTLLQTRPLPPLKALDSIRCQRAVSVPSPPGSSTPAVSPAMPPSSLGGPAHGSRVSAPSAS